VPGDEARRVRSQPQHRLRNLVRLSDAAHRLRAIDGLGALRRALQPRSSIAVRVMPGHTALMRMPSRAYSAAALLRRSHRRDA
jgi:hypothetical protein